MERHFTTDYVERATLRGDTQVVLRLIVPEDKALLRQGFDHWSPESRYARFLVPKQRLSDEELRYLCEVDQETHFAIGAVSDTDPPVGLGIARFIRLPDRPGEPVTAEAAIAVADEAQGKGLGKLLFLRLVAAARERGIAAFRCDVLVTNDSMKDLIESIAPRHTIAIDTGVMTIDFELPEVAPEQAATQAPEGSMYEFFRAAAKRLLRF